MHRGKINIDVEVENSAADNIFVHSMDIEGDITGLTCAIIAGAFGAFNPDGDLKKQLEDRIKMQKAIATAILNGTVKLMGSSINIAVVNALSSTLKTITDINIHTLTDIVKNTNELKETDEKLRRFEEGNQQGGSGKSSFDDFS